MTLWSVTGMLGTAALGVLAYVLSQFAGKPIESYWELRRDIARCLVLYANADSVASADDPLVQEARAKFRDLASSLVGLLNAMPLYRLWAFFGAVPSLDDLETAKTNLIGLSNGVGMPGRQMDNSRRYEKIQRALKIPGSQ